MIRKIYCTDSNCVWLTDRVCAWTSCPKNKRLLFTGDIEQYKEFLKVNKPPEPVKQELEETSAPHNPKRGNNKRALIGTDADGKSTTYPTVSRAIMVTGTNPTYLYKAIKSGQPHNGITWRYA